ncbi:MAG: S41 family peptidase [Anaerofustis sp.]
MEKKKGTKKIGIVIFVLVLITTNVLTFFATRYLPVLTGHSVIINAEDDTSAAYISKMLYLKDQLEQNSYYNDEFTEEDLWDAALNGLMSGTGDKYAYYFNKKETEAYKEESSGSYVGIGVVVGNNDDGNIEVTKVFSGSPAEAAGIEAGDVIISADDTSLIGVAVEYGVTLIKGDAGTTVKIGVQRGEDPLYFDIVRSTITYTYVDSEMLSNDIGYIHIYQFENNTYDEFSSAVSSLQAQGMKGLVLDLRQNPGGLVDQALDIADDLLPQCDMMYTVDTNGNKVTESSDSDYQNFPVVVLVDEYSASASEILSVALKVNDRAVFVGETTYGKGIIQTVMPIVSDGTMFKYTVYEYFGADGTKVQGVGITPDYQVEKGDAYDKMLVEDIPHDQDVQLQKALEVMRGELGE